MTESDEMTLYDEYESTPRGARELAAADLAISVGVLLRSAFGRSEMTNNDLAHALGVTAGRASQILNGDGNLRVSTVAKVLHSLGWKASVTATNTAGECLPAAPRSRRPASAPKTSGWTSPAVSTSTYCVEMVSSAGVGTHVFDVEHDPAMKPVMLAVPEEVDGKRRGIVMEGVTERKTFDVLDPSTSTRA